VGGAHRDYDAAADIIKKAILAELAELEKMSPEELIEARLEKYASMGFFNE
jgi:acetyl-CoA carboxylase carboxyl transferase subunit alpha